MGPVEFLLGCEGIDLVRGENFLKPGLEDLRRAHGPLRKLHFSTGAIPRLFPNTEVHIGVAGLMGDPYDLLESWSLTLLDRCDGLNTRLWLRRLLLGGTQGRWKAAPGAGWGSRRLGERGKPRGEDRTGHGSSSD